MTAVLLGLTMVMSLAGCGQKKESTADTAAAGSEAAKTERKYGRKEHVCGDGDNYLKAGL